MNGVIEAERNSGIVERRSAVDVAGGARWTDTGDSPGPRSLLLAHAARSVELPPARPRRAPRESRRVSLAQAPGYVQLNQYRLLEPIGQGSYGIVKLAYNEEDDTHYAMKILSKRKLMRRTGLFGRAPPRMQGPGPPPDPLQRVYREIAVLKKLDHPNVVKLVEVLDDPAEDQLYLVFQLLEGGPVIEVPTDSPLSEEVARKYFRDVLLGVEYLHYQGIAHRDLKPANLLLGEGRVQVADLGACGELAGRLSGAVGTPAFRAPEATASTDNYCGEAADVWSLGVTLFAMVTGRVPWSGGSAPELQRRVQAEPLALPRALSAALRALLARLLHKEPARRLTLREAKEHEWVTAGGREPLPSEQENCRLVEVTDEDLARVVTSIPNLSTLILIKTMLKKHSFQNPFLRSREGSAARRESAAARAGPPGARRGGLLARAGRSLSAPGNYLTERQASFDVALESVQEGRDQSQDIPPAADDQSSADSPGDSCQSDNSANKSQSVSSADVKSASKSVSRSQSVSDNQVSSEGSLSSSQTSVSQKGDSPGSGRRASNSHSFRITQNDDSNVVTKSVTSQSVAHKIDSTSKQNTSSHSVSSQINSKHNASSHGISNQNVSIQNDSSQSDSSQKDNCQGVSNQIDSCQSVSNQKDSSQSGSNQIDSCQSVSNQIDSCQSVSNQIDSCQRVSNPIDSCQSVSKQKDNCESSSSQTTSRQNVSKNSQRKSSQDMKER